MKSVQLLQSASAIAVITLFAGCSGMDRQEKDTAVGAGTGAVAGAVVAGPIGAVVGGAGGAYAGHEIGKPEPKSDRVASTRSTTTASNSTNNYNSGTNNSGTRPAGTSSENTYSENTVRSVQQRLNEKGYDAGAVDGRWGSNTENALRKFQQAQNLPVTGTLDTQTTAALGIDGSANVARSSVNQNDNSGSSSMQSNSSRAGSTQSDTSSPSSMQSGMSQPSSTQSDTSRSNSMQSGTSQSSSTQSGATK